MSRPAPKFAVGELVEATGRAVVFIRGAVVERSWHERAFIGDASDGSGSTLCPGGWWYQLEGRGHTWTHESDLRRIDPPAHEPADAEWAENLRRQLRRRDRDEVPA